MNVAFALLALLALAPGQGGGVGISNMRLTFGELGPARPNNQYLPRDFVFICKINFGVDLISQIRKTNVMCRRQNSEEVVTIVAA